VTAKTLRWELWHTPARLVRRSRRRIVRVLDTWPTTWHLLHAYQRLPSSPETYELGTTATACFSASFPPWKQSNGADHPHTETVMEVDAPLGLPVQLVAPIPAVSPGPVNDRG
jgi:hypothetical protein